MASFHKHEKHNGTKFSLKQQNLYFNFDSVAVSNTSCARNLTCIVQEQTQNAQNKRDLITLFNHNYPVVFTLNVYYVV